MFEEPPGRRAALATESDLLLQPSALLLEDLSIAIGDQQPVRNVSLRVSAGSVHCLVGDSGSGKTLTSLAAVGLLPRTATACGSIRLQDEQRNLVDLDQQAWSAIRGHDIGYVGQNALGCLHPAFRVGAQLVEAIRRHQSVSRSNANEMALEQLAAVELDDPQRVARAYPAQLSGGMCQRVAIAMALCNQPSILIADEPTTSLDVDIQDRILALIRSRVDNDDLGVLLITHDQTVVAQVADEVTHIADGVSSPGPVALTPSAAHLTLRAAEPQPDQSDPAQPSVLKVSGVTKAYRTSGLLRRGHTTIINDVSFEGIAGSTIGLVGRSGAGKTTVAKIIAGVLTPTQGTVSIDGHQVAGPGRIGRAERADLVQYVFQDPFGSLNPRRTPLAQVAEPLLAKGESVADAAEQARLLLRSVGLDDQQISRTPATLSGGQCQRVGIARALIRRPPVVVLDEPVSALDWSIRDEIMAILAQQQLETNALYLLISHDRELIEQSSDRILEVANGQVRRL